MGVSCRDRDDSTAAAGGPERRVEAVEDGRDAQAGPELLVTAKTQRWKPEEFWRTLIEAEIASRDESNVRTRMRQANFPVTKTLAEFDVAASSTEASSDIHPFDDCEEAVTHRTGRFVDVGVLRQVASVLAHGRGLVFEVGLTSPARRFRAWPDGVVLADAAGVPRHPKGLPPEIPGGRRLSRLARTAV